MQDLLPRQKEIYRYIEDVVRVVLESYGYTEIGVPVLESTQLFSRLVGEATDIVEKEMYTFEDRNGDSLTMRPEGTAGVVRMGQENGLLFNQIQRFWYAGPMFRHERPQKGRYRQFEQVGAECFGMAGPDIDAELLFMCQRIWETLGISDEIHLELNSMGTAECRAAYRSELVNYLEEHRDGLDEDSMRRLETNPLRILDSKVPKTQELLAGAPTLTDFLDGESKMHFDQLRRLLDQNQLFYHINPSIVRGLDYYNKTVFEWVTDSLGAQGTVCGGGRYDGLVEQVGGKSMPGVGFAMGLDRLAMMLDDKFESTADADIYIASLGEPARAYALLLAEDIRGNLAHGKVVVHCADGKLKSQMKKADASGANIALIIGEEEVSKGEVTVKDLQTGEQQSLNAEAVIDHLSKMLEE